MLVINMMNLIAISLLATSLVVSSLFSPTPYNKDAHGEGDQVILKDGRRAVVVEYADVAGDGNTKVVITPPRQSNPSTAESGKHLKDSAEEGLSRATAAVAGVAQDTMHGGPRELICDAYGKCKEKVSGVFGKAKEAAVEAEETVEETVKSFASKAAEKVEEKVEDLKDKVVETKEKVEEKGKRGKKELSDIARRGKEVVVDVVAYGADSIGSLLNLMGFGMAYGIGIWVTFIMSNVLARILSRQQFGLVQSRIYPSYFKAMFGSIGLALVGHLLLHRGQVFKRMSDVFQGANLLGCLVMVFGNYAFLEPRATKVIVERMKLEKEEGRGMDSRNTSTRVVDTVGTDAADHNPTTTTTTTTTALAAETPSTTKMEKDKAKSKLARLDERLKNLNLSSSILNVMTLMGLTWHLVYLSQRLTVST